MNVLTKTPAAGAPSPILVTEAEAASLLGISQRLLWTLRNDGEVPFVPVGKVGIRYRVTDLEGHAARRVTTRKEV